MCNSPAEPRQLGSRIVPAHSFPSPRRRWRITLPILIGMLGPGVQGACERSPTAPTLEGSVYVLGSVDGRPVPAVIDSTDLGGGENRLSRIVGRSLDFLSRDSVQYAGASDVVERLPDGTLREWGSECSTRRAGYRREGSRIILTIPPLPWEGPRPPVVDTLTVEGERLVQQDLVPGVRTLRLEYVPGPPSVPVCALPTLDRRPAG